MSNDAILVQLGYSVSEHSLAQLERVIANTREFEHIRKHIVVLNDHLKHHDSFVALSSTNDYFKIKNLAADVEEVNQIIFKWAEKYKVELEKVSGKNTYYIIGFKS